MADRTPEDKKIPLKVVMFRELTAIPGATNLYTMVEAGARRLEGGKDWAMPQPWFDPVHRVIRIEGRCYPMERVHYYEQTNGPVKPAKPLNLDKYTLARHE